MVNPYIRPPEYARMWGVHLNTVYHWIKCGYLPGVISRRISQRKNHYIPIGVVPPRLFPGPLPGRRQLLPPEDVPPWEPEDHNGMLPKGVSMEDFLRDHQITIDQLTDEKWEVKSKQCQALTAKGSTVT